MDSKKRWIGFIFLITFIFLLFDSHVLIAQETIKIGVVLSTTGRYAAMGTGQKLGASLAVKRINEMGGVAGRKVEMIFEDDEGDPGKGTTAIRKLITVDKVVAIFGSSSNIVSHAISLIAEDMKVPLITPAPSPKLTLNKRFVFQNVGKEELLIEKVGNFFEVKKWKKVGILHDDSEYGMDLSQRLSEFCSLKGIVVSKAKFSTRASDVSPQWLTLRKDEVEGIFLVGGPPMGAAIALKNRKQLGITIPVIASPSLNNDKFLELAVDAAEGITMVSYFHYAKWTPGELTLINYMKKEAPDVFPTLFHALGWDGIYLFANAMKRAGNDPLKIRDELEKTKKYQGAVGEYNFSPSDHNGLGPDTLTYVKVENGKFVYIEE